MAVSLHVAMQHGPSLYPLSRTSDVWSLRIPINSVLGFWRFIVSVICAIAIRPFLVRCACALISSRQRTNFSKSAAFEVRSGLFLKNGMTTSKRSLRR